MLPDKRIILMTDTVGFIQKLPAQLIAAFRATLEEISDADLLLHVIDVTHPVAKEQAASVIQTLKEIKADHIPVINVLNKIDQLTPEKLASIRLDEFPESVAISGLTGLGIEALLTKIDSLLFQAYIPIKS